ncbi:MAG: TRAP transporter small permease [Gammaproteobacteria bacterium]|nr:TRAP transporter small permease [Gammaproteobacteria bacterium]
MLVQFKNYLLKFEAGIAIVSLVLMLSFSIVQILARNLFETGFPVLDVISRHLVLFILFSGAALITEYNKHIKIDVLATLMPAEIKKKLVRPFLLISTMICALFFWHAGNFWLDELKYASTNDNLSVYLALVLPAGFFMLTLHFFLLSLIGMELKSDSVPASFQKPPA